MSLGSGFDMPTHAGGEITFKPTGKIEAPPPIDGKLVRDLARYAYRTYHRAKMR